MSRRASRLPAMLVALVLAGSCRPDAPPPPALGAVLPLSGPAALWGEQARQGIVLALEEAKASGASVPRVELVFEDSRSEPLYAVMALRRLVEQHQVAAVIGELFSSPTLAMAPVAREAGIVLVTPSATSPDLATAGGWIFRLWPSERRAGEAAGRWAAGTRLRRAALLHSQDDYGIQLAKAFRSAFEGQGGAVVAAMAYSPDRGEVGSWLLERRAEKLDVVFLAGPDEAVAVILRQAKEIGLATRFLGVKSLGSSTLLAQAGPAAEGLIVATVQGFDLDRPTPAQRRFFARFQQRFGTSPDWLSAYSFDAASLLLRGLRARAKTGEPLQALLAGRHAFQGVTGTILFNQAGEEVGRPVVMEVVRGGRFVVREGARGPDACAACPSPLPDAGSGLAPRAFLRTGEEIPGARGRQWRAPSPR